VSTRPADAARGPKRARRGAARALL